MSTPLSPPDSASVPMEATEDSFRSVVPTVGRPSLRTRVRALDRSSLTTGQNVRIDEKIYRRMVQLGLSQQALSQKSGVSDSEISRLLNGQSKRPGLHNILRLARALEVSLDYLADDELATDPRTGVDPLSGDERHLLDRARQIGLREVEMILDATRVLGFDMAIRRLYGLDGRAEPDHAGAKDLSRP
ncbi:helix-turn-helix domain-containing protein [Tautonia sociabilis]|nr:helix-turn-helix transcriptional regulator [Tautonia sociabilis]